MSTNHNEMEPDAKIISQIKYETEDVKTGGLLKWGIGFFSFVVMSAVLGAGFFYLPWFRPAEVSIAPPFQSQTPPPGTPILQNNSNNTQDIADMRQAERKALTTYGKGDAPGFYRIPIDKALDIVATSGFPAQDSALTQKVVGSVPSPSQRANDATQQSLKASQPVKSAPAPVTDAKQGGN